MSKAIKKPFEFHKKMFKKGIKAIKKYWKPILTAIVIAAAIYFTAGMASGAFASAGTASSTLVPAAAEGGAWSAMSAAEISAGTAGIAEGEAVGSVLAADAAASGAAASGAAATGATTAGEIAAGAALDESAGLSMAAQGAGATGAETAATQGLLNSAIDESAGLSMASQTAGTEAVGDVAAQSAAESAASQGSQATNGFIDNAMTTPTASTPTNAQLTSALEASPQQLANTTTGLPGELLPDALPPTNPGLLETTSKWFSGLSPQAKLVLGQTVAQAGTAGVNALSARGAQDAAAEEQRRREERSKVPDITGMFRKYNGGIIGSRMGGG
jgi:hypothetical protein